MMNIYAINIVAPILKGSEHMVSYNEYPIMCVTKKTYDEIIENESVKQTIIGLVQKIGEELLDQTYINIRIISSNRDVTNISNPIKKYYEQWMY